MGEAELRRAAVERDEARQMLERALDFSCIASWQFDPRTDDLRWRGATAELWGADFETALSTGAGFFARRSEEHTSELQSLMRISYAVFCLNKKTQTYITHSSRIHHNISEINTTI